MPGPQINKLDKSPLQLILDPLWDYLVTNNALQFILLIPFVVVCAKLFGFFLVWGSCFFIFVAYSFNKVAEKRVKALKEYRDSRFNEDRSVVDIEEVGWLNMIIRKYYVTCLTKMVEPHINDLKKTLEENRPPFLYNLTVGEFVVGKHPPVIDGIRSNATLPDNHMEMDWKISFAPTMSLEIRVEPVPKTKIPILVDGFLFGAKVRVNLVFNDMFPDSSLVTISFLEKPQIDFQIKPLVKVDILSLPLLHEWLEGLILDAIEPIMLWPQEISFTLGGDPVETMDAVNNVPLVGLAVVPRSEKKCEDGFRVVSRTVSGEHPANINSGNTGRELFLAAKKSTGKNETLKPITDICIIFPKRHETVPKGFVKVEKTPGGRNADLNMDNKGRSCYLCYRRGHGNPITRLAIWNKTKEPVCPKGLTPIELTYKGYDANLNSGNKGDQLYLCYRGGSESIMGFSHSRTTGIGLLRVRLICGMELKIADMGGTSDPFCILWIEGEGMIQPRKKNSQVKPQTLEPEWNETFILRARRQDYLRVMVFDHDLVGKNDPLGDLTIPLDGLVCGQEIVADYRLDNVKTGKIRLGVSALDFGLPSAQETGDEHSKPGGAIAGKIDAVVGTSRVTTIDMTAEDEETIPLEDDYPSEEEGNTEQPEIASDVEEVRGWLVKRKETNRNLVMGMADRATGMVGTMAKLLKKYYFVLSCHELRYYESDKPKHMKVPLATFDLDGGEVNWDGSVMRVKTRDEQVLELSAVKKEDESMWLDALREHCQGSSAAWEAKHR